MRRLRRRRADFLQATERADSGTPRCGTEADFLWHHSFISNDESTRTQIRRPPSEEVTKGEDGTDVSRTGLPTSIDRFEVVRLMGAVIQSGGFEGATSHVARVERRRRRHWTEDDHVETEDQTPIGEAAALVQKIADAKTDCGGFDCVVGGGFVMEDCLDLTPLGAIFDAIGPAAITEVLPAEGAIGPEIFQETLRDTLTGIIADTCDVVLPGLLAAMAAMCRGLPGGRRRPPGSPQGDNRRG